MTRRHRAGDARGPRLAWGLVLAGRSGNIAFGLILIATGVVLWLTQQGLIASSFWRHGWPWIIVLLAVIQLATARSAHRLGDGVTFGLLGVWLLMVESHWRGLTWENSWPLSLAAIGAGMVARAFASLFLPERPLVQIGTGKEDPHDV